HKVTGPPLRANPTNPYQHNSNQQQQQQAMGGGMLGRQQTVSLGPVSYRPVASDIIPISQLSVYSQKWTIKGRVSSKSDVRTFNNARGEGQLFSIELVDDQSAEIRATFFNSAVTKFFPAIQQGKVYTFSKGQVKQANARFNPGAAYELTFNDDAIIEESTDSADIPRILYKISKIATIQDRNPDEFVDLCGIVTHCSPISTVVIRTSGQERARRNFTIADDSGCSIEMTVWGDTAQHCGIDENRAQFNPVVMIKNARISNYGGKSLTTASTTTLEVDPDDSRAFEVKNWWIQGGQTGAMQALSTGGAGGGGNAPKTVIDVMRMDNNLYLSLNGQAASDVPNARPVNTHTIQRATVAQIFRSGEKPLYYTSCITEIPDGRGGMRKCSKKVEQDISTGTWSCIDGHQNPQCMPRYIINLKLADISGEVLVRAFDDQAQALLG
ncbi:60S acidic ribosomal protein P1, partial [Perkinsus olseni]